MNPSGQQSRNESQTEDLVLGIDIGGTNFMVLIMEPDATVVDSFSGPTRADDGPEEVVDDLTNRINCKFDTSNQITAAGVGVAGLVDRRSGLLRIAPNLVWENVTLGPMLSERLDVPVEIANDVDAATYGEWRHGAGQGARNVLGVFIGTGVGTGVIAGGSLLEGERSSAAELGHVPVVEGGRKCTCGYEGCLEAYVGGWAVGKRAREQVLSDPDRGKTLKQIAGSVDDITAKTVSEALDQDDKLAAEITDRTAEVLSSWAVGMVNAFHPGIIVVGGGLLEGFPHFIKQMTEEVREGSFDPFHEELEIVESRLGDRAGAIGAATMAYREQKSS